MDIRAKFKNFMITSALMCASVVTLSATWVPTANAFGIGVQPSTVEMTIKPGDRHRQIITIGNVQNQNHQHDYGTGGLGFGR